MSHLNRNHDPTTINSNKCNSNSFDQTFKNDQHSCRRKCIIMIYKNSPINPIKIEPNNNNLIYTYIWIVLKFTLFRFNRLFYVRVHTFIELALERAHYFFSWSQHTFLYANIYQVFFQSYMPFPMPHMHNWHFLEGVSLQF